MKKIKYTQEQIEYVKKLVEGGMEVTPATRQMCEFFEIDFTDTIGRAFRKKMQKHGVTKNVKLIEDTDVFQKAKEKQFDSSKKRFIISWAQNATPVHEGFLKNIEAYAKEINASIHFIAGRYKNPTSTFTEVKNDYWVDEVLPYLDANRHNIHPLLAVLSDVKIQPTASTPLSGLNGLTGLESCIVGHPRLHLVSLPVLEGYPQKSLFTTGAVTVENYTDSKSGKKSAFHHTLGFCVVELDGEIFHLRQVCGDNEGNFYDLKYKAVNGKIIEYDESVPAMVFGDLHLTEHDDQAVNLSFEMADRMKPEIIVIHDAWNGHSISHHEKSNPFILLQRELDGSWCLEREMSEMVNWFNENNKYNYIVVSANHNDFIDRWLINEDWRKSTNKAAYLKYASITASGEAPKGIVAYILDKECGNFVKTLDIDESYRVLDWELSIHGHQGSAGSRGSAIQFKNLNTKNITGHTHSSHREDGHLCVGTLTKLRVGYNKGMSKWNHSNVVIYPNGKASHIHIIRGRYTTFFD